MGQTLTRLIQKVTYSPDVDKQLDNQNAAARDKRELFKNKIANTKSDVATRVKKIATVVNEKYKKRISDARAWLDSNRNARPLDIDNQIVLFTNDCKSIELLNEGNLFYERVLALADLQGAANNKITKTVGSERSWYNKNIDLPLKEYTLRKTSVFDPAVIDAGGSAIDISKIENVDIIGHQEKLKKRKKQNEVQPTFWEKIVATFFSALWTLFYIAIILAGGSLGANLMVHRPVPYRILAFIYGCLASPLLIIYSIFRLMKANPIVIYSMFIPIFKGPPNNYLTFFSYSEDDKLKERQDAYIAQGLAIAASLALSKKASNSKNAFGNENTGSSKTSGNSNANAFGNENTGSSSVKSNANAFGNENTGSSKSSGNSIVNAFGNENTGSGNAAVASSNVNMFGNENPNNLSGTTVVPSAPVFLKATAPAANIPVKAAAPVTPVKAAVNAPVIASPLV